MPIEKKTDTTHEIPQAGDQQTQQVDRRRFLQGAIATAGAALSSRSLAQLPQQTAGLPALTTRSGQKPRNIIFILTDDHRYDAFGFLKGQPWLDTPVFDQFARDGVNFKNSFVTTALCSPSRATLLTGMYAHKHKIVDNNTAIPPNTVFFPQYLQRAGYNTAFIGKWHMGNQGDEPQPGFDHWVSFRGQGSYLPVEDGLNVDGKRVPQGGYITDVLTDYALTWLRKQSKEKPYFLYLSHKAVHADFVPPEKYRTKYKDEKFVFPKTMAASRPYAQDRPAWVKNQRNSWHGVEFPYHSKLDIAEYYKLYMRTFAGVEDSTAQILAELEKRGELD